MGMRFRKSINLGGGVRLNVSKKGIGMSAGVKGARVGIGPRGTRKTLSIPGTGISYVSESRFKGKTTSTNNHSRSENVLNQQYSNQEVINNFPTQKVKGKGWLIFGIFGLLITSSKPIAGMIIALISGIMYFRLFNEPNNKSSKLYNKATKLYAINSIDQSIKLLEESVGLNPDNSSANLLLSMIYHDKKKDYEKTLKYANAYIRLHPEDKIAKFAMADSYFELRDFDNAIELLQAIDFSEIKDIENERIILLGRSFYEKGQYELATETFKKGPVNKRTITDSVLEAKYWLGLSYLQSGETKKAKTQLAKVYIEDINYKDIQKYADDLGLK